MLGDVADVARQDLERAELFKKEGNSLFSQGDLPAAEAKYTRALRTAPALVLDLANIISLVDLRIALFSNRALVYFRLGWYVECINDCSSGIVIVRKGCTAESGKTGKDKCVSRHLMYCKLLTRRASAWKALGFYVRASNDLTEVLGLAASGGSVRCSDAFRTAQSLLRNAERDDETERMPLPGWELLPLEHRLRVASLLPLASLGRLQMVSHEFKELTRHDATWSWQFNGVVGRLADTLRAFDWGLERHEFKKFGKWSVQKTWHARQHCLMFQESELADTDSRIALAYRLPMQLTIRNTCPALVLDIGMCYTKAGFAGAETPSLWVPNILLCGHCALVDEGRFTQDITVLERLLMEIFNALSINPSEHPVILCLSSYNRSCIPHSEYDIGARSLQRCLTETFGVPSVCTAETSVLTLLGLGRHTGIVVDIGLGSSRVIPVIRGEECKPGICTEYIGAANLTNYLLEAVRQSGVEVRWPGIPGFCFMLRVKNVKEDFGFVAMSHEEAQATVPREINVLSEVLAEPLHLGRELANVGEMFFTPCLIGPQHSYFGGSKPQPALGLHQLVQKSIMQCGAISQGVKQELVANVAIAGGTSNMPGMQARLQTELQSLLDKGMFPGCMPHVLPSKTEPAWLGGSVLGSAQSAAMHPPGIELLKKRTKWRTLLTSQNAAG